jgi:hypothetical protein
MSSKYEHRHITAVQPMCYIPVSIIQCFQILSFMLSLNCCFPSSLCPFIPLSLHSSVLPSPRPSVTSPSVPLSFRPSVLPSLRPPRPSYVPVSLHSYVATPHPPPFVPPSIRPSVLPSLNSPFRPSKSRRLFSSHISATQCPFSPNFLCIFLLAD